MLASNGSQGKVSLLMNSKKRLIKDAANGFRNLMLRELKQMVAEGVESDDPVKYVVVRIMENTRPMRWSEYHQKWIDDRPTVARWRSKLAGLCRSIGHRLDGR